MKITVRMANEAEYCFDIAESTTFDEFATIVSGKCQMPTDQLRLFCGGKTVENEAGFLKCKNMENPSLLLSRKRRKSEIAQMRPEDEPKTLVGEKFELAWTLMNNCEKCLEAVDNGIKPAQRERVNAPDQPTQNHPTISGFGNLVERISRVFEKYGKLSEELSEDIIRVDHDQEIIESKMHRTQLLIDCSKYMSVLSGTMSNFIIPLRAAAPRRIHYRQSPVRR